MKKFLKKVPLRDDLDNMKFEPTGKFDIALDSYFMNERELMRYGIFACFIEMSTAGDIDIIIYLNTEDDLEQDFYRILKEKMIIEGNFTINLIVLQKTI